MDLLSNEYQGSVIKESLNGWCPYMSLNCVTVGSEGRLGPVKLNMELNMATTVPADLDLVAPNGDYL